MLWTVAKKIWIPWMALTSAIALVWTSWLAQAQSGTSEQVRKIITLADLPQSNIVTKMIDWHQHHCVTVRWHTPYTTDRWVQIPTHPCDWTRHAAEKRKMKIDTNDVMQAQIDEDAHNQANTLESQVYKANVINDGNTAHAFQIEAERNADNDLRQQERLAREAADKKRKAKIIAQQAIKRAQEHAKKVAVQ